MIPRHRWEKRLWLGVVPVFLCWNSFPFLAATLRHGPFSLPEWAVSVEMVYVVRCCAAVLAVVCYFATLTCWLRMGRSWTMAIVPGQKTELVTGGLFGWVRHPIYSLSMLLMICSVVTVATVPMLFAGLLHLAMMNFKAKNEERHLADRHGLAYVTYCSQVGRFVPRLRSLARR